MTLQQWADNGWLAGHETSKQEIANLLKIVERDLKDAREAQVSNDWRLGIAYNAALKLCTVLLYAEGFRAERNLNHYRTIQALQEILGKEKASAVFYLDACRKKRNIAEYDYVGGVTENDAIELVEFTEELREEVLDWLQENHTELL